MDEKKQRQIKQIQDAMREHQHKMETDPEYKRETEEFLKALGGWPHPREEE